MSTEVSGDCVCRSGGGRTPRSCPNPGSWANLQAWSAPEGALLLADPGRPVSSGLLPRNSAHSLCSRRPARGKVARAGSWPASEASWVVFSGEAELVSREVAGLELGVGIGRWRRERTWASDPLPLRHRLSEGWGGGGTPAGLSLPLRAAV